MRPNRWGAAQSDPDVVVVGCGAGGGVMARELAEAGLRVVVLEAGDRFSPASYRSDEADFEIGRWDVFRPADRRRDVFTSSGPRPFHYQRVKGVGGSTLVYSGVTPRFRESDFRIRSLDGVGEDWPLAYPELEPYYTRVEYELGVSGPPPEEAPVSDPPRSRPYPNPPHAVTRGAGVVAAGGERLGIRFSPAPLAILSRPYDGRPACVRAGVCEIGCMVMAKSSNDVTYVPKALATGRVEIRTLSTAREVFLGPDGRARGVRYLDAQGNEGEVRGRAVVVAGSALETPRLLLLSSSPAFPDGLANSSGLVGRYFSEHMALFGNAVFEERIDAWAGGPVTTSISLDFGETDPAHDFVRGFMLEASMAAQTPVSVAERVPGWGADHKARMAERFGRTSSLVAVGEQIPRADNRVVLDPEVTDAFGLPVPRIEFDLGPNDEKVVAAMDRAVRDVLEAAGAEEIDLPPYQPGSGAHYFGSCRMGEDPATSVVDRWGRTHDVPNLFLADSSVFTTGGTVNPALTIMALSTRTADHIVEAFRRGDP